MKCLILLSVIMSITAIGCTSENVYICTGPQSEVYHKKSKCRGLSKCSCEIKVVSLSEAKGIGRRPCEICIE